MPRPDEAVTEIVTAVTFTENLLRSIVNLNADQQLELVQDLAAGGATNGPVIGTTFESEAVAADVIPTVLDIDRCPLGCADGSDSVWIGDQPVPGIGAGVQDFVVVVPDAG